MSDAESIPTVLDDLAGRPGYDPGFLGVPLPVPCLQGVETVLLPYMNFSVLMRADRRLAAVTALGIDGPTLRDLGRSGIRWRLDPRLRPEEQTGGQLYEDNDLDRGHLVRRASACRGRTVEQAATANEDTFHYTNAAPQAAQFNQGMELWLGLETYLLDHAADHGRRLTVFTGPIFGSKDPEYRGTLIPLLYFKVAAFLVGGELAATGYVVDQTPQLSDVPGVPRPGAADEPPPLGPFRTFQTPIRDIAALTGLDLGQLTAVDRMPIAAVLPRARTGTVWRELTGVGDLDLGFDLRAG